MEAMYVFLGGKRGETEELVDASCGLIGWGCLAAFFQAVNDWMGARTEGGWFSVIRTPTHCMLLMCVNEWVMEGSKSSS